MVTIGTNGGNTVANLSQLAEYVQSLGSELIMNYIPCNESGTQVSVNSDIDSVRNTYRLRGVDFDKPTSLSGDGSVVDTSLMWDEDYSVDHPDWGVGGHVYHHPNVEGAKRMFSRILIDCPDLI